MPPTATESKPPKFDKALLAQVRSSGRFDVAEDVRTALVGWLANEVARLKAKRDLLRDDIERYRMYIKGRNPNPPVRQGMSNVSVPLIMWVRTALHGRIVKGIFDQVPFLAVEPAGTLKKVGDFDLIEVGKVLGKLARALILDKRAWNGRKAVESSAAEDVDLGLGAIKVSLAPDEIVNLPPNVDAEDPLAPVQRVTPGSVRWDFIPFMDLLHYDGYGTDVAKMPLVGHEFPKTWASIQAWAQQGHYDQAEVDKVEAFFDQATSEQPASHREHNIAEIYTDYDVNGDGILEPVVIDWHVQAEVPLRVAWNQFSGFRPIVMAQFDIPADPSDARGIGTVEKLESPQQEANAIHNIGIEAGKRGIAHVTVVRKDSAIDVTLGTAKKLMPGDIYATEDVEADIKHVPLGDPRAAEFAIALEEHNRVYAARLFGLDESRLGNVESGKRVPASLGLPTMKEGRVVLERAGSGVADMMAEATYLSFDVMRRRLPLTRLRALLSDDEIEMLRAVVLNPAGPLDPREHFRVVIRAQDVATAQEARKTELFALAQFLLPFFKEMAQMVVAVENPQTPVTPQGRAMLVQIAEKAQNAVALMLGSLENITDVEEVLLDLDEFKKRIEGAVPTAADTTPAATVEQPLGTAGPPAAAVGDEVLDPDDLGGGVT